MKKLFNITNNTLRVVSDYESLTMDEILIYNSFAKNLCKIQ